MVALCGIALLCSAVADHLVSYGTWHHCVVDFKRGASVSFIAKALMSQ